MTAEAVIHTAIVHPEDAGGAMLKALLLARGHRVESFSTWEVAWPSLRKGAPSVVLFALPVKPSLCKKLCARLRELPGGADLLITAFASDLGAAAAMMPECALDDVIALPFEPAVLGLHLAVIEARVKERRARALSEAALLASRADYQAIFDTIPYDVFVKDRSGRIVTVNKAMERTFGLSTEELKGRQVISSGPVSDEDRITVESSDRMALDRGQVVERMQTRTYPDGSFHYYRVIKTPLRGADGAISGLLGIAEDVTERERSQRELRASQALLRTVFDTIPHALWVKDADGRYLAVNEPMSGRYGRRPEEYIGLAVRSLGLPPGEDRRIAADTDRQVLEEGRSVEYEVHRNFQNGESRLEHVLKRPLRDESGRVVGLVGMAEDITESRRSHAALRQSQALLQVMFDTVPHMMFVKDPDSRFVLVNKATERHWGIPADKIVGNRIIGEPERTAAEIEEALRTDRAVLETRESVTSTTLHTMRGGRSRMLRVIKSPILDEQGNVTGIVGMSEDVTGPVEAMNALRSSQRLLRTLIDALPQSIYFKDPQGRYQLVNRAMAGLYGMQPDEFIGLKVSDLPYSTPEELQRKIAMDAEAQRGGEPVEIPEILVTLAGRTRWERGIKVPVRGPEGEPLGIVGIFEDITQRKHAQDALSASQRLLQAVVDALPQAISVKRPDGRYELVNQTSSRWFGVPTEQLVGQSAEGLGFMEQEFLERVRKGDADVMRRGVTVDLPDMVARFGGGTSRWVHLRKVPLSGQGGAVGGILTIMDDVTARKQNEVERLALERQVLHAQKLESLGVLAGGIAHDFNNLLTGILGNVELAELDTGADHPAAPSLKSVRQASLRAAALTQQMLAYSGRGNFQVQSVDLNVLVTEISQLLKVSISKKVALHFDLAPRPVVVRGDATQLQQIVMNLITNAAEAIGDASGEIRLATGVQPGIEGDLAEAYLRENHRPGPYAFVDVSDTGCGMTQEVKARIFDPFFTTKFTGRGLGLAAVLGIVRAHHGLVRIQSASGQGSSFRVLLPPLEDVQPHPAGHDLEPVTWQSQGTILLVDDEAIVRAAVERQLARLGFGVCTADNGVEALRQCRAAPGTFRAVLLDMTMPEMDGAETLRELRGMTHRTPVILCSGYAEDEAASQLGTLAPDAFLQKPVTFRALSDTLRSVLGE